jgi:V8-like Glu-specific endopeptidase
MSSLPFTPSWRRMFALTFSFVLLGGFVVLAMGRNTAVATPSDPADPNSTPCIAEDPFDLEGLRDVLSSDTPPSTPVRINEHMMVEYIGEGELLDEDATMPEQRLEEGETNPTEPPREEIEHGPIEFAVFNTRTQFEFKVTLQEEMLDDIYDCHEATGRTNASVASTFTYLPLVEGTGSGATADPTSATRLDLNSTGQARGWSNGTDNRILINNPNVWPIRTIAQFRNNGSTTHNSNCSGTLIGPRHIITAAHCINEQGTDNWFRIRITPAKNGFGTTLAQEPHGSTLVSLNPDPGTEVWYFTPWQWRDPEETGWQWDWGLLVIPDRLGDRTAWMGYFAASANYLNSVSKWNRGYPQCNTGRGNSPIGGNANNNCQNGRMYGDVNQCNIGTFSSKGADGWHRRATVSCDLSGGHSGSPVYFWHRLANNTFVPVVTMVISTEACSLNCAADNNFPNGVVRLTPANMGTISWLREVFP